MQLRDRFIVRDPPGLDPTLAHAAHAAGAWALIDATHPGERAKLDQLDPARTVLRVDPDTDADPTPDVALAVVAPWRIEPEHVDDVREAVDAWHAVGVPVGVEVRTKEEGRRAVEAGADVLLARGAEGPGRVSERSNLVLLPALAELDADVDILAWGGAGPNATGALLVHADAVVLDAPVYLVDESPLGEAWQRALAAFDGSDVEQLGATVETPYHVHARVADEHVHEIWEAEQASQDGATQRERWLRQRIEAERVGFDDPPGTGLVALGHDGAHASVLAEHGTLEAVLDDLETRIEEQLSTFPLEPGSELAKAHGTRYPIVQGAMANVSEVPAFARAVADEGALPFLAFAALREAWAREALEGTLDVLGEDQPFGCGIIGLDVNAEKRDAHIRLLKEHTPPYALIAAGTAEQALDLEQAGIDTYLHTPSRGIVRQALEMGLSRVVVEGNECGGHIGKLPSLVLWDQALQEVDAQGTEGANVLLAGGISDAATSAMAGTLAAGTPARVGALMGTAYLATEEITETGAIPDSYQDLVLAAKDTEVTGRTTGIRARSAPTPFTQRITELERDLIKQGRPLDERKHTVEHENLGATRLAARKLKRGEDGTYHEVSTDEQLTEGNFLMGQGAELITGEYTIRELHEAVTSQASQHAAQAKTRLAAPFELPTPATGHDEAPVREDAVAIVGLGCVFPDAPDVDAYWENLLEGHVSIKELPEERWPVPATAHHRPDEPDGTYTLLGGFVEEDTFDPIEHRIPPTVADQMDASQAWTIQATQQALEDAGLTDVEDRARWAVILGNAQGGEQKNWTDRRLALRETLAAFDAQGIDGPARDAVEAMLDEVAPITEDTMPGELSNIIASRVCNTFDIGGPARTVDTACASSLAAIEEAVRQLRDGDVDVAITGGVDRSMHPSAYAKFSAIGALSREGSFPFDERASGFVMGEGCGVLVLKRLTDAVDAGDRIYAVVEGAGSSSDGAGKGITAPDAAGQARAIERAWEDADADPRDLAFVEAHGTGTPVGDPTEAQTLTELFDEHREDPVLLGSVKANIGHLKSAAGAAGAVKAALAIHHRTLPPTPVETPTSKVDWDATPLELATEPAELPDGTIRAGVSAFGFGGTNSHLVLASPPSPTPDEADAREVGIQRVSGTSREALADALETPPGHWRFDASDPIRVALHETATREDAEAVLAGDLPPGLALSKGIAISVGEQGELGLVFPGQGSQYPGMVLDLAEAHPAAREVLEEADQVLTPLIGRPISEILALEGEEGQEALTPTEVCQPAVLTCDIAILRVLEEHGVEPDVVAGHSLGEYAALVAAGVLEFEDALHAVSARGKEMADVAEEQVDDPGGLVAVRAGPEMASELIDGLDAWPANLNGPEQTVLAGTTEAMDTIEARADEAGIKASRLPVSAAFHSPIVAPATEPLRRVLERIDIDPPEIPVIANTTADPYPDDPDAIRDLLAEQVANPVRWMETMDAFEARGVELIVETGPKPVLTGLARETLPETMSVPTAHPRQGAQETLEIALTALAAHGHLSIPDPPTVPDASTTGPAATQHRARDGHASRRASAPAGTPQAPKRRVVVSGVSLGLPSSDPGTADPFDPAHREALLAGENRIAPVPDDEKRTMAGLGVTRLVKDGPNGPQLSRITDTDDVVQLAGRLGEVDLASYAADEDWLADADPTARLGVAAALEALTDARIPLVPDEHETSTGTTLTDGWVLPEPMQDETGVILASAFPGHASLVDIVTDHATPAPVDQAGRGERLTSYLADLVAELDDRQARKAALDLLLEHADDAPTTPAMPPALARDVDRDHATNGTPSDGEADGFPRDFLFRTLAMGHAQIAQLIDARGPNLQVNAACASTTAAIALAQDWIEQGRCERVIVVGADVAGNEALLPWIGSGFLAAGAATTSENVEEAALPFDERRHGMLVGSGAVGLVLETEAAADERGVTPLAELVEAHVSNSAYHGARLEPDHVAEEVAHVVDRAQDRLGLDAGELARELVFVSHEPATPARGGSAEAEIRALRHALGDAAPEVLVTNTKGLTGHAMGAGIEDGVAVELLRARQAPPVANLEQVDPDFEDITFSDGTPTDRSLALRFAAGFGSQVALALFHRTSPTPGTVDEARFDAWLETAAGEGATVETRDRCLRVVDPAAPRQDARAAPPVEDPPTPQAHRAPGAASPPSDEADTRGDTSDSGVERPASAPEAGRSVADVEALLTDLISRKTGYPEDVIEPGMDLEADLGVDTVKQAEVLSEARSELDIGPIEGLSLSDVPTLEDAAELLAEHVPGASSPAAEPSTAEQAVDDASGEAEQAPAAAGAPSEPGETAPTADGEDEVLALLTDLVSRKTGYPEDVIEPGMDLEADLGVDTVKQAEVLSEARSELDIGPIEGLSLSDVPTLEDAADLLAEHAQDASTDRSPAAHAAGSGEEATDDPAIGVLSVEEGPAPAASLHPDGTRVARLGALPASLAPALEARGAAVVDAVDTAEIAVVGVEAAPAEPVPLVELLETLQAIPAGTRIVLVADADEPAAGGLPALAGTLTEEGTPARAVLVTAPIAEERLAREALVDHDASVRLGPETRRGLELARAGEPSEVSLPDGAVVLAPGGLGAAVAPCLARLTQAHDVRLAIAGRSPIEATDLDPDDEAAVQALRDELLEDAKASDGPVRPAEVEAELETRVKRARRARTLERLEETAEVRYVQVDATEPDALAAWVQDVTDAWQAPAVVVHGAGLEASRAFDEKTSEEMHAVLDVKLTPVRVLTEALPEAHHVAFGSIAGVTGNPGQADYALANGALAGLLAPVDGTVLHWTAWDAAGGMADDESVRTVLEARDVTFLDPDQGAGIFAERFATPGTYLVSDLAPTRPLATEREPADWTLTGDEAWLHDHSIGDRPLVPGVRHLQAMVETGAHARGQPVRALHEARFEAALWVREPRTARVTVDQDSGQARVEHEDTVHARARLGPDQGVKPLAPVEAPERGTPAEEIYETFFHGPAFQVLERADAGPRSVRALADLSASGAAPWAMALEACLQAAGLGDEAAGASMGLPAGVEEVALEQDPTVAEATVAVELVERDLVGSTWDATVRGPDDEVLLVARGLRLEATEATSTAADAVRELTTEADGIAGSFARVAPHDPRDPRAKRDAEHAAGTEAAERALQEALGEVTGVTRDDDGAPHPQGADGSVSITHGHGLAIAVASDDPDAGLGVDLERVEARSPAWREDVLTEHEQGLAAHRGPDQSTVATTLWTLKEAASKALGTGLSIPASQLEVTALEDDGTARISTPEGELVGRWHRQGEAVVSLVTAR